MCDHENREAAMTVIRRDDAGTPTVWCDPCLEPLVRALNDGGLLTVASCCGHGHRPGRISLADGRELFIAPDYDTARAIDDAFPTDINGDQVPTAGLLEEGRRLASERDNLIAQGVDPAELLIPVAPTPAPGVDRITRGRRA